MRRGPTTNRLDFGSDPDKWILRSNFNVFDELFMGGVWPGSRNNRLDFSGDPDPDLILSVSGNRDPDQETRPSVTE